MVLSVKGTWKGTKDGKASRREVIQDDQVMEDVAIEDPEMEIIGRIQSSRGKAMMDGTQGGEDASRREAMDTIPKQEA